MIRIGAINYLNSLPLIRGIEEEPGDIDLCFEVPSRLATHLRAGLLDLALVPQVEACRDPDYRVVPEICIASGGSVDSILLFARRPIEQIERVGTDAGSHTSVELLKVL
ncbi:MAG: MqnA/MqnD/SBP family protein, partial [Planctomycetota bacterium]